MLWYLLTGTDAVKLYLLVSEAERAAAEFVQSCQDEPTATLETWRRELEKLNIEQAASADAGYLCSVTIHNFEGNSR